MAEFINRDEFYRRLHELANNLFAEQKPALRNLLVIDFDKWPKHLQDDALSRLGLRREVVYFEDVTCG